MAWFRLSIATRSLRVPNNARLSLFGVLFLAFMVATIVWVVVFPGKWNRRILIFPDTVGGEHHVEYRLVPRRTTLEDKIDALVHELLLGPVDMGAVAFLPKTTSINSVVLHGTTVYIDLSEEVVFGPETGQMAFEETLDLVENNLFVNFPTLREIVVTIAGNLPGVAPFRINQGMTLTKEQAAL